MQLERGIYSAGAWNVQAGRRRSRWRLAPPVGHSSVRGFWMG
jgi:hypothetical protein